MSISSTLSSPLAGRAVQTEGAIGWPVSIDGRGYLIDTANNLFARSRPSSGNTSVADTVRGESVGLPPDVLRRFRESWVYGAGQSKADRDDSIPYRYRSSYNIDPWDRWSFTLHKGVITDNNGGLYNGASELAAIANYVFVYQDSTLFRAWVVGPEVSGWQSIQLPNKIASIDSDGRNILVANGPFVHKVEPVTMVAELWRDLSAYTGPATWEWLVNTQSDWAAVQATYPTWADIKNTVTSDEITMVRFAKNRVIAGIGNRLFDLTLPTFNPDGSVQYDYSLIYVDAAPTYRWTDACDGLSCIYILGGDRERWAVQRLEINDDGIALKPPITSADLPAGETGGSIASYMGYIAVGSSTGIRIGVMETSGDFSMGQLIPLGGKSMVSAGYNRFFWAANPNFAAPDGSIHSGLIRLDMSRFTEPLTPAYANDICIPGNVMIHGAGHSMARPVFTAEGVGLCIRDDLYATEGELSTGRFFFGTPDAKHGQTIEVHWAPLDGSAEVAANGEKFNPFTAQGSLSSGPIVVGGTKFYEQELSITLHPTLNRAKAPVVYSIDTRSILVPGTISDWVLPIMIRDTIELNGSSITRRVIEDYRHLIGLVNSGRSVQLRVGSEMVIVNVTDYEWRPTELSRQPGGWQGLFILKVREA